MKTETTKKSIPVSNLTLELWLDYVRPAAIKAGLLEEVAAHDESWGDYTALHTDAAFADDVAHCMYCACMGQSYHDLTHEEIVRAEAERMVYQLDVTAEFDLHHTKDAVVALRAALAEMLNPSDPEIPEADLDEAVAEFDLHHINDAVEALRAALAELVQKAKTDAKATDLIQRVREYINLFESGRSAWDKGVRVYADELLDELLDAIRGGWVDLDDMASTKLVGKALLNGADDWRQYSWGGCSLIYDQDIAERLCTPSELKKTRHGERRPNGREEWLDVQYRALVQAAGKIRRGMKYAIRLQLKEEVA